jgi:hypothetical protein
VKRLSSPQRAFAATFATALVAAVLPFGPAFADDPTESPSPSETTDPSETPAPTETTEPEVSRNFGGYTTGAWSAPVKIEIYEPMIPFPSTPQLEVEMAYSEVESDSAQARGRSSFLWPGAPIGEGFKTIIEQFGLPPSLGKDGYPVQVNSLYPNGPDFESDEPIPGMVQRAGSEDGSAYAETAFSTDGQAQDYDGGEGDDGGLIPGLPLPGLDDLLGGLLGGSNAADGGQPSSLGLPPALGAVIDLGGFTSVSKTQTDTITSAVARSSFGDISLLGGLIRIEGLKVRAEASSDGAKGTSSGVSAYGDLIALGQRFAFGPDGFEAVGTHFAIPGLPDQVTDALSMLGVTVSFPKPVYEKDGDAASASVTGMVIEIDMGPLKKILNMLPLADLLDMIPEQAGQLKDALGLVMGLSSRIVISLANANAKVDTVAPIAPPTVDPTDPATEAPTDDGTDAAPPIDSPPITTPDSTDPTTGTTDPPDDLEATPLGAGLPPLFSIPGILLVGGIALATVAGSYFRKAGAAALGGGAPCPHGLDSGLPDLRKA